MSDNFFSWWREKCGRNWAIVTSIVVGLAAMIGLYTQATPLWEEHRPWATPEQLQRVEDRSTGFVKQIAERAYPIALADQQTKTASLKARLKWLEKQRDLGELEPAQHAEIPVMRQLIEESEAKEAQIIKERTFFRQLEHTR